MFACTFTPRETLTEALSRPRRLYILCWSEFSRRRLLPAVSPAAGHLTTPTVAGLPGLCKNFRPTTSKSSPILRLLSSHWAISVVRTRVVGVANVGDSLRRLSSLQHRIYNLLGQDAARDTCSRAAAVSFARRKQRAKLDRLTSLYYTRNFCRHRLSKEKNV